MKMIFVWRTYHRNSHEKGNLIMLYLGTNGHQSAAQGWLPFILPPVFVQAAVTDMPCVLTHALH